MLTDIITNQRLAWKSKTFKSDKDFTLDLRGETLEELKKLSPEMAINLNSSKFWILSAFPNLQNDVENFKLNFLDTGYGFGLIKGLNSKDFSKEAQTNIYWLIENILGTPLSQNINGEKLVVVKDEGKKMEEGGRYHHTRQGGSYHTDSPQWSNAPDYLGLLCYHHAWRGGESKLLSVYSVHNRLLKADSNLLKVLYSPFHFDKRGEFKEKESPTTLEPIFKHENGNLYFRYLRNYIDAGHEVSKKPLTKKQIQALKFLDEVLLDEKLVISMRMHSGDVQYLNNHRIVHGRTAFTDFKDKDKKRVMLRSWVKRA
ncbi:MAG TPA: TauD/TfdA family dioxygenase [Candidatus Nanoarchaeia archaeon]|nr:TauD/TfdA family dioxygenase [Candidatus Nanoarchaeia archaeon]